MNGEIAQRVALVCYGNAALSGHEIPDLFSTNSTSQFCASILFNGTAGPIGSNPNEWFHALLAEGVRGLRLAQAPRNNPKLPDRVTAGFSGGGSSWAIEAAKPDGMSDFYIARWAVGDRKDPNRRLWLVEYKLVTTVPTPTPSTTSLQSADDDLTSALRQILAFAINIHADNFAALFANALDSLANPSTHHGYHQDLFPAGSLSPQAAALLDACQAGWVFGGMGSWNDMGLTDAEYERVSDNLYRAITEAIPAAANDSFPPPSPTQ
ncbi:MAG: hypothetical protein WBY53_04745 [Acidobacteriaceae bacterium]